MIEKIGHVKNPLTIIAIFAGLAEVFGTLVIPLMDASVQRVFVWFLMFFPVALVSGFFFLLWYKHEVLYAPSDFRSDDLFERIYTRRSPIAKISQERFEEAQQEGEELDVGVDIINADNKQNDFAVKEPEGQEPAERNGPLSTSEQHVDARLFPKHQVDSRATSAALNFAAEEIGSLILSEITGLDFERNVSLGNHGYIYDAISISSSKVVVAEIKYFRPKYFKGFTSVAKRMIETLRRAHDELLPSFSRSKFEGIALLMIDSSQLDEGFATIAKDSFENYRREFAPNIPMKLHIFTMERAMDTLSNEEKHKKLY
jgi:hypothetical protein